MIALWRLSNSQDLRPRGRPPGRWHGPGAPVVVLDASPAAAVFARLAQAEVAHRARCRAITSCWRSSRRRARYRTAMRRPTGSPTCRPRGRWAMPGWRAARPRCCCVPSAAGGLQYLLNAEHPQLAQCQIVSALAYPYLPHLTGLDSAVLDGAGWLVTARPGE
ncbi:RES domain-containing protein [Achromobacter xylosoxidans]